MKTKEIIEEYFICKGRVLSLKEELKTLERVAEIVKTSSYVEESHGEYGGIEALRIEVLDKRQELELKIVLTEGFIAKVECALGSLKRLLGQEYNIFELRHFENNKLETLQLEYGYASVSTVYNRLKKHEERFEKIINTDLKI